MSARGGTKRRATPLLFFKTPYYSHFPQRSAGAESGESGRRGGKDLQASWPSAGHNLERVILRDDHDLVAVDFIGGNSAEGSLPCLEDKSEEHTAQPT